MNTNINKTNNILQIVIITTTNNISTNSYDYNHK